MNKTELTIDETTLVLRALWAYRDNLRLDRSNPLFDQPTREICDAEITLVANLINKLES